MALADLVRMANQISANLVGFPDDVATAEAAAHLRSYWTPPMREELLAYATADGSLLSPGARRAVERLRELEARRAS